MHERSRSGDSRDNETSDPAGDPGPARLECRVPRVRMKSHTNKEVKPGTSSAGWIRQLAREDAALVRIECFSFCPAHFRGRQRTSRRAKAFSGVTVPHW